MAEDKEEIMEGTVDEDPSSEYEKQRISFISDLKRFNANRGTPFDRVPEIAGDEIDLYHLYQRVTALGGWQKVNFGDLWEDFLEDFGLPNGCVNAAQALKNVYFRYLNLYEKVNFLGEDPDVKDHDEEDGPTRKKVCLPIETIPLNYNYNQHKLSDAQRQHCNLSTELYVQKEYEKLEMSLRSGLPNEVDMAINVCVLLSTEGRHCMQLEKTCQLLRLLMAHVAVFEEDTFDLQELYHRCWMPSGDRNFLRFWFETVDHPRAKPLITFGGQPYKQKEMVGNSVLNLGRDLGTLDSEGQRVLQLAVFLHNLSFEESNQKILAENYLVFKFLMLSLHSTYDGLRQIALDTIANLSCEITVDGFADMESGLIMDTLNDALFSDDRFFLVRGMEMLGKLSQIGKNSDILLDQLREETYKRLVDLLTVQDIQLIVHTLEALYKLSKIGEPFTTKIAKVHKAISVLISLITIEAQSFGPGSLVGIKVVEYIPPTHVGPGGELDPARKPTTVIQPINPDSINIYQVPAGSALGLNSNSEKSVVAKPAEAPKPPPPPPPLTDIHTTTSSWLNATFELKKKSKVNQVELFSDYLQFCRKFGITNAMSSAEFLHLVKVIFHQCEVISINRKNGDNDVFLEGLCKRSTQKPFAVTTLPPEKVRNPVSVNVSPKQSQAHTVDSLFHTPTLRQRLMEPPRVPLSPHRYPHPGATSSASPMSTPSSSVQASSKVVTSPLVSKGSRPQVNTSAKIIPSAQTRAGPVSPLANSSTSAEDAKSDLKDAPASQQRLLASHTHPSIQQALQLEQAADVQSVKSLLAKKLSHAGSPSEVDRSLAAVPANTMSSGVNSGQTAVLESGFHSQPIPATAQPIFRVSNPPVEIHQHQPHVTPLSTSQSIHTQHHTLTTSLPPAASSNLTAPVGRYVIAQPSLSVTSTVGNSAISTGLINSVYSHNSHQVGVEVQQNLNQNSILSSQNHGSQSAHHTSPQIVPNNVQQNGQVTQVGTFLSAQSQQSAHVQIRPSSTTPVLGNNFVTPNPSHFLQNQPQNGPPQLKSSFPASSVKQMTVGQQQQSTVNFVQGTVSPGGLLRAASPGMPLTGQQLPCNTVAVQGPSLTQAISSPAVAALLTSNNPQGSSQMIISSPMLGGNAQGQIVTRPAQQQQQVPTTVVIQTPPGTIVMPSRQMQGGTVSFIVPPQYRQGSPVTFIQQQPPAAAGGTGGVNMLSSLALANSGAGGQSLPAQQTQIVLATPGQTIPMGMQLSSLQGNTIIRNHPVGINSMQQQPQQHNYVIQASSSQLSSTSASSLPSSTYQIVAQQTPAAVAGTLVSNINSESQQTRSEVIHQSSMPSVVMQQVQCNGSSHDQNNSQTFDSLVVNDTPPSPSLKPEKEMVNGKGSHSDLDTEHIKSGFKLGGKVNGLIHSSVTEHGTEVSPTPTQTNANSHGTVLVNGCVSSSSLPNQNANIPIQGLQIRSAGGIVNGVSQNPTIGPQHQLENGFQSHQQQQSVVIQQSQLPSLNAQAPLQQRQLLPSQQAQLPLQTSATQVNLHQVQNQVVHIQQAQQQPSQQAPQFQRIVSVRPAQPGNHQALQATGVIRPRISTLSCPMDQQQQQQQLQQSLQAGPRPAGLPRSGSAPIGEAAGHVNSVTNTPTRGANRMPNASVPLAGKKRPTPAKAVGTTPVSETASRLRKKKPNEVVVTPGSVQTRKQAQGQKSVHIAMQYMCEWGSCRKCFSTARLVLIHVFKQHVPHYDSSCQWMACEKLVRKRWSLISHIQDHHCSEMAMRAACQRRYTALQQKASGATPTPPPPAPTPMIYPPDAAMQAIRRFSVKQPYSEFAEQREGPVSKHIRLTSALILRNICHASSYGRQLVRQHEEVLSYNTMSVVESSTALSHCLWEISQCCDKDPYDISS
ncbi:hypothetical protein EGW08_009736 [Elysia chlorotica]|uniref:ARID domain-containing protein n=1 Tax=Elysia chlorotica TaxID=188477 RepID=A0A3S1C470_ELYCH|nr:hypothetical protein EGW08_009736 [Elysia chlorotica]